MVLPKVFIENPFHEIEKNFLSEEEYSKAVSRFINVCTDIIIINEKRETIFLPKRVVDPMKGLWVIGGGRLPGEEAPDSAVRCFLRETSLKIDPRRLAPVGIYELIWATRKEEPQDAGKHDLIYTFSLKLSDEELTSIKLNPEEYDEEFFLQEFDRKKILETENWKGKLPILRIYDDIFLD